MKKPWRQVWQEMQWDPRKVGQKPQTDLETIEVIPSPTTGLLVEVTPEDRERYLQRFNELPFPVAATLDPDGTFPRWREGHCKVCMSEGDEEDEPGPFVLKCPSCGRLGCPECIPLGRGCNCPECEEKRDGT